MLAMCASRQIVDDSYIRLVLFALVISLYNSFSYRLMSDQLNKWWFYVHDYSYSYITIKSMMPSDLDDRICS